jgi:acyl transferase domain-containing protein/NAD(P)-dependent dehydrogenase (short-subunit alcohol dehydrogenase family)/acyl carrier protein
MTLATSDDNSHGMTPAKASVSARQQVAIVGIGCRLPGRINTPNEFVTFLRSHGDAVVEIPAERWNSDLHWDPDPHAPGKTYVRRAALLSQDIFSFDPDPFGVSSKEAEQLDPQQRLLLEVTWEAFEDAGMVVDRLRGSNTAVFVGGFTLDYQGLVYHPSNRRLIGSHSAFGSSMTLLSNRLSYTFDLRGPSLTVDTACSSSLVATHLAYESIARGECDIAVVGGVNVILTPSLMVTMSKAHFLAADGRSKTFDARADGYGRGEGAAVVVLKTLERAIQDGDRVYAVIVATGVNQDGRTPGMAVPSEEAQRNLCQRVLHSSGLRASEIGYVEAHGTGTRAGDPIEVRALGAIYGRDRDEPLVVGSLKTNVGHLEACAGVAGLIKAALSIYHREIFPLRAIDSLNPDIPFDRLNIEVARQGRAWPSEAPASAAVNSFGYGGTNAHVILREATSVRRPSRHGGSIEQSQPLSRPRVVPISAANRDALLAQAAQLCEAISDDTWEDQAFTLARRRGHLPERAAVFASSADDLREELRRVAQEEWGDDRPVGRASAERGVIWVFTGMGPQWWGMGQELYHSEPSFQKAVVEADRAFQTASGWSLLPEMLKGELVSQMRSNSIAQPANFTLQVGLVGLLRDLGVPAHGYLGHSVGELAAAWAAGCLSLEDAAFIAYHRSRLQQRVAGRGTMLAVALSEQQVNGFVHPSHDVTVAAYNAPNAVTLSGSREHLDEISQRLSAENIFNKFVPVEVAYHSPHMDSLESEFRSVLSDIEPHRPEQRIYSTARGTSLTIASHDGNYWWENARRPVLLQRALEQAMADGYTAFLEIGPHPVLAPSIREVARQSRTEARTFFCLKRGQPEGRAVRQAMAALHASGVSLDWERLYPHGRMSDLPKYPFCRKHHWSESDASREWRSGRPDRHFSDREDGATLRLACSLARPSVRYFGEHRIQGTVVFPAAAYIDYALAACREKDGNRSEYVLDTLRFERALILRTDAAPELRIDLDRSNGTLRMYARHEAQPWELHARGRWLEEAVYGPISKVNLEQLKTSLTDHMDVDAAYRRFERFGLQYGPEFRGLRTVQSRRDNAGGSIVLARVHVDAEHQALGGVHPVRIDSAFQAICAAAPGVTSAMVPVSAERIRWFRGAGLATWAHGRVGPVVDGSIRSDLVLLTADGSPVFEIRGLVCRALDGQFGRGAADRLDLYHLDAWRPHAWPNPSASRSGTWALVGTASPFFESFERALHQRGIRTRRAAATDRDALVECSTVLFALAPDDNDPIGLMGCEQLRQLAQRLDHGTSQLRVATFGAHQVSAGDVPIPSQAALWGFGRVLMTEQPELACRLIDLPRELPQVAPEVVASMNDDAMPEEGAVRNGSLYVHRVRRATNSELSGPPRLVPIADYDGAFVVQAGSDPESTHLVPRPRVAPTEDEIEVAVLSQSLGACDGSEPLVATTGGHVPDLKWALQRRMRSTVGTVQRIGPKATRVCIGDTVHVLQKSDVMSHVIAPETRAVILNPGDTPANAVAYSDLFLAWYALCDLARLEEGDHVLISNAGSAIGAACVQVAALCGARILVTASEEDLQGLQSSQVHAVYSSHTLDFVEAVRRDTADKGVQAVINLVGGPARLKSAELLGPTGRFVDLNAASFEDPEACEAPPLRRGQSFMAADLDSLAEANAGAYALLAQRVFIALRDGRLVLPATHALCTRSASNGSRTAVKRVSTARLTVDPRGQNETIDTASVLHNPRPDKTYLITGGLSGFGLATAQWLVEQGARNLVLASRRGHAPLESLDVLSSLLSAGARVECRQVDVADEESVEDLLAFIRTELPPLAGLFHSAMVLDDHPVRELGADSLRRVMNAKALGAWLLYQKTRDLGLEQFVLYSSISALVGNPNQAGYAAANAVLDALATACRSEGHAAMSIAWGAIDDVGVVAENQATRAHLQGLGVQPIPVRLALAALRRALVSERSWVGVIDVQWGRWMQSFPRTPWTRLAELSADGENVASSGVLERRQLELAEMDAASKREYVLSIVRSAAAQVLGRNQTWIDEHSPLSNHGFDSLMAVDLQSGLEKALGISLPLIQLLAQATLVELADRVLDAMSCADEQMPENTKAVTRRPEDLREYFLSRICVQPPYFQLFDFVRDGDWVEASVRPVAPTDGEDDLVSCAESARHLAIVGSCAVSLKSPFDGKVYYPVHRAYSTQMGADASDVEDTHRSGILETALVRARCISFDKAASRATAECELLDLERRVVSRLIVDYHVIPSIDFVRLFAARAETTRENSDDNPYESSVSPAIRRVTSDIFSMELGPIDPSACLGHFVGYPALPLSIMTRHVVAAIAAGVRTNLGPSVAISVLGGWVETHSFLFAHESAAITAQRRSVHKAGDQVWACEVRRDQALVAVFELTVRTIQARVSAVHAVRGVKRTA